METRHVSPSRGDVLLLVGTMKGAFLLHSRPDRKRWTLAGPYFQGEPVYAMALDTRAGRRRLWAATGSWHWGPTLRHSDDFGKTWSSPEENPLKFPKHTEPALKQIWQVALPENDPSAIYAGVEPAALFVSRDEGKTFELVETLWNHPHRPKWQPGGGGLCMHTVLPHPQDTNRVMVAASAVGIYRSDDHGESWRTSHSGVRAQFLPDPHPEFGQCVHKVSRSRSRPERLYLQNHWGLYRSDDDGASWKDIANGVPSDFGFPVAADPHDEDTAFIVPLESDGFRCVPEGKLRVYRTKNAGKSWEPLSKGLPQKNALETVLRDGLDTDTLSPTGVYFGTRSGRVYGTNNGGNAWSLLQETLPPVACVKAAVVGGAATARKSPAKKKPANPPKRSPSRKRSSKRSSRART
ncbi:MAG: WD40/YVTN/BNR-like repeat-containing protein [Myxococcaceae bacterium]